IKLVITNHWGCKDSTQAILHPDGTITGNKPNSNRQSTTISNIYPNPAAQSVRLDYSLPSTCQEANLKIYELGTGRILLQKRLSVLERATRLDVSSLPQGLYGCQLYADGIPAPKVQKLSVVR
ncbi:Por secretion system C-terminal sorting domain-containing protein, partial [Flexibacter flexilis DSM 6793]